MYTGNTAALFADLYPSLLLLYEEPLVDATIPFHLVERLTLSRNIRNNRKWRHRRFHKGMDYLSCYTQSDCDDPRRRSSKITKMVVSCKKVISLHVTRNSTDNWKRELFLKSIFGKINFCNFNRTTHQTYNGWDPSTNAYIRCYPSGSSPRFLEPPQRHRSRRSSTMH